MAFALHPIALNVCETSSRSFDIYSVSPDGVPITLSFASCHLHEGRVLIQPLHLMLCIRMETA